jgi:hypothetical protein
LFSDSTDASPPNNWDTLSARAQKHQQFQFSSGLQEQAIGQVVWVNEAGFLSVRQMLDRRGEDKGLLSGTERLKAGTDSVPQHLPDLQLIEQIVAGRIGPEPALLELVSLIANFTSKGTKQATR